MRLGIMFTLMCEVSIRRNALRLLTPYVGTPYRVAGWSAFQAGALAGGLGGFIGSGGDLNAAASGALFGGISGWFANTIGHGPGIMSKIRDAGEWVRALAHGMSQGLVSRLQNGSFRSGFWGGFMGSAFPVDKMGIESIQGRVFTAAVVGGTASAIGGGKFANGATTAAFSYLFSNAAASRGPRGRALTADEVSAAKGVFGDKIDYSKVQIIDGKYVPWQGKGYVMAPDGNIYWPGECGNLASCGGINTAETFIHETTHVLQYQHGVNVLGRGLLLQAGKFLSFGLYDPYSFTYAPNQAFSSYNIEQQGRIAEGIYGGVYPNNIDY